MTYSAFKDRCDWFRVAVAAVMKIAMAIVLTSGMARATEIFVSSFTDPGNEGSVGGGLLTPSASNVPIGTGPWLGTYNGIFGLLAPPTLTVDNDAGFLPGEGAGIIGEIAGINVLGSGLLNNSGWFFQDTGIAYQPNTLYTLTAKVFTGGVIDELAVLSNAGAGIGLTDSAGALLASSTDPFAIVDLDPLSLDWFTLTLQMTTDGTAPPTSIGIRLFNQPSGLLTADLLAGVAFTDVRLDASAVPEPTYGVLAGILFTASFLLKRRIKRTATSR